MKQLIVVLLLATIFLSGCNEQSEVKEQQTVVTNLLLGTWVVNGSANERWQFYNDTMLINMTEERVVTSYSYSVDGNVLSLSTRMFNITYNYKFARNNTIANLFSNDVCVITLEKQ